MSKLDAPIIRYGLINKLLGADITNKVKSVKESDEETQAAFTAAKQQVKDLIKQMVKDIEVQRLGKPTTGNQFAALMKSHVEDL